MRKKLYFLCLLLSIFLPLMGGGCSTRKKELIVSAAASLKDSFEEIGKAFERENKGTKVLFNFAGSGFLRVQIEGGAVVDVFASAGEKDMDLLEKKGLIKGGTRRDFAENEIVLIAPARSKFDLRSFTQLSQPVVKYIAIADPKLAPVGQYSKEFLEKQNLWKDVEKKIIPAGDVKGVLDYVARGEVDVGIVYRTDALIFSKAVKILAAPPRGSYTAPRYPIAVMKNSREPILAEKFISFVLSPTAQRILRKYGFRTVTLGNG
jgi:molybdate transport system substrate-binding protein